MKKFISTIAGALMMFALSAPLVTVAKSAEFFTIGTDEPTGAYFQVGNAICKMLHMSVMSAEHGRKKGTAKPYRCAAPSTGGSNYNIEQIKEGEFQFGVAQSNWQYHAYNGSSKWEGKQFSNLRAVFSVHVESFQIWARKGSKIKDWNSLKNKIVNLGNSGSDHRGMMELLMKTKGVDVGYFKGTEEFSSSEQVRALCDKKIDAYVYLVGFPNDAMMEAATCGAKGYIINLDDSEVQKLIDNTDYFVKTVIPKDAYPTLKKDVTTFGIAATFVTSADVSEELVYLVTKAVFENFEEFKKQADPFKFLEKKNMIKDGLSIPLHHGAIKYYKESGLM